MPRDDVSIQMELDLLKYQSNHVFLDIIPTTAGTPSRPRARVTPPAAVAVSSSDLFGHHYSLMAVEEESKNECDEEKDGVHDGKGPGSLEHGAVLVDVDCP